MGTRWELAPDASLSFEGTRREADNDDGAEHGLMLHGRTALVTLQGPCSRHQHC